MIVATTAKAGTIDIDDTDEVGSACEPNHWSTEMLMLSRTKNVSIAAVISSPQLSRRQHAIADTASRGSQIARSCTYTGLVTSPVPSSTEVGRELSTAGTIRDNQAPACRTHAR